MLIEVLSLALFSIITVHSDFQGIPGKGFSRPKTVLFQLGTDILN